MIDFTIGECVNLMQTAEKQANAAQEPRFFAPPKAKPGYEFAKRAFDIVMSFLALVILSPVFLAVSIAIHLEDGGNVIYSSIRLTKNGKEFKMYKFRSMCMDAEQKLDSLMSLNEMNGPAFKIAEDPRITKVGKFIRKTSIDELPQLVNILKGDMSIIGPRPPLPQLINILKGDMSIVGPRPALPREVEQYTPYQMHRLDVKTGLACYHECEGRSDNHDFDQWVEADLRYIRERSMWTDLKIIFMTIKVVLTGKGAV